jgi:hypothetical protein
MMRTGLFGQPACAIAGAAQLRQYAARQRQTARAFDETPPSDGRHRILPDLLSIVL